MMTNSLSPHDWQNISEYLDGQLDPREMEGFNRRLAQSEALQTGLEEMRGVKTLLRELPHQHAPHNFTLSHDLVPQKQPRRSLVPVFRWATAFSGVMTVLMIAAGLIFSQGAVPSTMMAAAPLPVEQQMLSSQPTAVSTPVMIIQWGEAANGKGGGGGGYTGAEAANAPSTASNPVMKSGDSGGGETDNSATGAALAQTPTAANRLMGSAPAPEGLAPQATPAVENPNLTMGALDMPATAGSSSDTADNPTEMPKSVPPANEPTESDASQAATLEPITGNGPILGVQSQRTAEAAVSSTAPAPEAHGVEKTSRMAYPILESVFGGLTLVLLAVTILLSRRKSL
jgi:hypothetical protein